MKSSLISGILLLSLVANAQTSDWIAPTAASAVKNPVTYSEDVLKEVKKLYVQQCALCHGEKGKGDGFAGVALKPKPADFSTDKFYDQTDGEIFWKMTTGRAPMASYKGILKDEEIWKIIHYLRSLKD
ncbi:unnamed protein product [Symbiodinium microadriaticum]|nr:unnamed protein product [Symbiodinium microadriaticum]